MDDQDSAKYKKSKRRDREFWKRINEEKDKNMNSSLLPSKRPKKRVVAGTAYSGLDFVIFLEREHLLSRIPVNRIVGSQRSKKQSRYMRRGLRVDTNLVEFQQFKEVGIFSYLC